jgi:hypothetical protein
LAGIAKNETFISDGVLLRALARGDANLVLRNILLRLWGTQAWGDFIDDLQTIYAYDIEVAFDKSIDEYIGNASSYSDFVLLAQIFAATNCSRRAGLPSSPKQPEARLRITSTSCGGASNTSAADNPLATCGGRARE